MRAKIITGIAVVAGIIILFLLVRAVIAKRPAVLDEPALKSEIVSYCQNQMPEKMLDLPVGTADWKLRDVLIHKIETMPGPREEKLVTTTLVINYRYATKDGKGDWQEYERPRSRFRIERRYPEGITVQAYRM